MTLTDIVRNAYLSETTRNDTFNRIAKDAQVSRQVAKRLAFCFLWFPTEETLQKVKDSDGTLPSEVNKRLDEVVALGL